ncbi:MAG TPA: zinc-ribbon domain containing protein [Candidatus Baltobacteraceae bacterium]
MHVDEMLVCADCGRQFAFTAGEQKFYEAKGFANKPTRCVDCRAARKAMRATTAAPGGEPGVARPRETFHATCSNCGGAAELPFQPRGDKPVFCRDCFGAKPSYR